MPRKRSARAAAEHREAMKCIVACLDVALAEGDPVLVSIAISLAVQEHGMSKLVKATGMSRDSLYRSLSMEGNLDLGTVLRVLRVVGVRLRAEEAAEQEPGLAGRDGVLTDPGTGGL